jgi:predicted transcriptional regulator
VKRNRWVAEELGTTQITAQLEALTPPELEDVISTVIEQRLDMDVYRKLLLEEQGIRDDLTKRLDRP